LLRCTPTSRIRLNTLGLLALCTTLALSTCKSGSVEGDPLHVLLSCWDSEFSGGRPLEGRFVGINYAPYHEREDLTRQRVAFGRCVRERVPQLFREHGQERLQAQALVAFAAGRLDSAISKLLLAADLKPDSSRALSDLAALYLARAHQAGSPHDLLLALSAAERALEKQPGLHEASFNRAVALERLFLRESAREAWYLYSKADAGTRWEHDARDHWARAGLRPPPDDLHRQSPSLQAAAHRANPAGLAAVVKRFPQAARELVEDQLLSYWGTSVLAGQATEAEQALATARSLALALASVSGEGMPADAVAAIDRAAGGPASRQVRQLAHGHAAYQAGLSLYRRDEYESAKLRFEDAATSLAAAGSPFLAAALLQRARCDYQHANYGRVLAMLEPLVEDRHHELHLALRGRALRVVALVHAISGRPVEALDRCAKARALFQQLHEQANLAGVDALAAEVFRYLGERDAAWHSLYRALQETYESGELVPSNEALEAASWLAVQEGASAAALAFQDEFVLAVRRSGSPLWLAEALCERAGLRATDGRTAAALGDLASAHRSAEQTRDRRTRRVALGDIYFAEGKVRRLIDPRQALPPLRAAVDLYRQTAFRHRVAEVLLEQALANLAVRQDDEAERALEAAAAERELLRLEIRGEQERASYFAQMREVFARLILFEADRRGDAEAAFNYAERSRGRLLLDAASSSPGAHGPPAEVKGGEPLTARDIEQALPATDVLIESAFAGDRLLVWVVRREGMRLMDLHLAARDLEGLAKRFVAALREDGDWLALATTLFERLINPIAAHLPPGSTLVLALDGPLRDVPFAALRDPSSGRFLIQDHPILAAPSATLYLRSLDRDRELMLQPLRAALIVADPSVDHRLFPNLQALPGARDEASTVSRILHHSVVLVGEQATLPGFLARAGSASFVHFAGHAVADVQYPLLSRLLFTPTGADHGVLYAREIFHQRFARTRLVVLAACRGAAPLFVGGEEVSSLAAPFLVTGVPAVLASRWNLDDRDSLPFFRGFYSHLAAGEDAATALRSVQLELLAARDARQRSPARWAGFDLLGGAVHREGHAAEMQSSNRTH
jgi:CHAT domain-containing protein